MREGLTPDILANEICMRRTQDKGCFLIVEGATDARLFKNFVDENHCSIIDALGKERAIAIIGAIEHRNVTGVLAIVDADFEQLVTPFDNSSNILLTDTHDLETMLLQSPALEKLLSEFGSSDKLTALTEDIRLLLLRGSTLIGCLRFISQRDALSLKFEDLSFEKFVDKETLTVNVLKLATTAKNHSQKPGLDVKQIVLQIEEFRRKNYNPWQVSCGHDIVEILSLGLRKLFGNRQPKDIEPYLLETCLRLSYDQAFFAATNLYHHVREWENRNQGCRVLVETAQ